MNPFRALKRIVKNSDQKLEKLNELLDLQRSQLEQLQKLVEVSNRMPLEPLQLQKSPSTFQEAISRIPLLLAEKTYNTSHPEYDANEVRNFPGRVFNGNVASKNRVYQALKPFIEKNNEAREVPDFYWQPILSDVLDEVKAIPHASQVFERKTFIEDYVADLSKRYHAHYQAGWVNMEDALFLYWMVRQLKPKTIVQTGVCNGLSTALMTLALVKNGSEGRIHVIDLPPIFDSQDPAWTVKGNVYGVVIPEGKSSGWIVPDAYRDLVDVQCGDAKQLLPPLVDKLASIDMFYHDSDHTYNHMMFEFNEAKRKITPGGLIVGDDISWNASVWDFADRYCVPSYNYKGAVGVAFF